MTVDLMANLENSLVKAQARNILAKTERQLSDPAKWLQINVETDTGDPDSTCVGLALIDNAPGGETMLGDEIPSLLVALNALLLAIGQPEAEHYSTGVRKVYLWNDNPATTHADVTTALAQAKKILS